MNPLKLLDEKSASTVKSEQFKEMNLEHVTEKVDAMFKAFKLLPAAQKLQIKDTLKGSRDAENLIDDLIKRTKIVRENKGLLFADLKQHLDVADIMIAHLCVDTFSKKGDIDLRLSKAGFKPEQIEKYCEMVTQPQGNEDDACFAASCAATSAALCCVALESNAPPQGGYHTFDNHHCHHRDVYVHYDYGGGYNQHGHW